MIDAAWWALVVWCAVGLLFAIDAFETLVNFWRAGQPARVACVVAVLLCAVCGPLMYLAAFLKRKRGPRP